MKTILLLCVLFITIPALAQTGEFKPLVVDLGPVSTKSDDARKPPDPAQFKADKCTECIYGTYDKMTGKRTYWAVRSLVVSNDKGKTGFGITTSLSDPHEIAIEFYAVGGGPCIDKDAFIYFLFRDGSRLRVNSQRSVFNCDGRAILFFSTKDSWSQPRLEELKTKPIETIRIDTYKSSVQRDFPVATSKEFMRQLRCLDAMDEEKH